MTHNAKRILVHRNQVFVLQNGLELGLDVAQIVGHEQGRRPEAPECHLRLALLVREALVSNDQHVGVKPTTGAWSKKFTF